MRTLTVEYEGTFIDLARPSLADGQLRRQIWAALEAHEGEKTRGANVFAFFITQVTNDPDYGFDRLTAYPGDDELVVIYERFCQSVDEMLVDVLTNKIAVLNGYSKEPQEEKKQSDASSNGTLAVTAIQDR